MSDFSGKLILNRALEDIYELTIPDLLLADSKSTWGIWCDRRSHLG